MPEHGFILAEEEAMRAKLSRITVADPKVPGGRRKVQVWYSWPTAEQDRVYPFITIDLIDIELAVDRQESAQIVPVSGWPSEADTIEEYLATRGMAYDPETEAQPEAVLWHPYNLHFQVATHARSASHDLEMTRVLLSTPFLPMRWGYLHVPVDASFRWLDTIDWATANYNETSGESQFRVFRKVFHSVVSAHMAPEDPYVFHKVLEVAGSLRDRDTHQEMAAWTHVPKPE